MASSTKYWPSVSASLYRIIEDTAIVGKTNGLPSGNSPIVSLVFDELLDLLASPASIGSASV